MGDHPIPFSTPMVCAILREIDHPGTGKTQTRRILKPQPFSDGYFDGEVDCTFVPRPASNQSAYVRFAASAVGDAVRTETFTPRLAVDDLLWVREAWWAEGRFDGFKPSEIPVGSPIYYQTDPEPGCAGRHRHGRFMCRWMSRLTLTVTDVRVQRLQDISEEDAIAEGIEPFTDFMPYGHWRRYRDGGWNSYVDNPISSYASLWTEINGAGSWEENPFVVAYTFTGHLANADALGAEHG